MISGSTYYRWRRIKSSVMITLSILCFVVAIVPLFLILFYTIKEGVSAINWDFFTQMPKPAGEAGGGMANALVGTGILIALASALGLPVGIFSGIYLSENSTSWFARTVRFLTEVLNGIPSFGSLIVVVWHLVYT